MKVILISGKARSGKGVSANIIQEQLEQRDKKVFQIAYADYLKELTTRLTGWNSVKDTYGRSLIQQLGTNIVRDKLQMKDLWINHVINEIKIAEQLGYTHTLITDCRFKNEIYIPKATFEDCITVRIERIGYVSELSYEQQTHQSETELDNFHFDITLRSMDGEENLRSVVLGKMEDFF